MRSPTTRPQRRLARRIGVPSILALVFIGLAMPAYAGKCQKTLRYRDSINNNTPVVVEIVNKTGATQTVEFGTSQNPSTQDDISRKGAQTISAGDSASFRRVIGESGWSWIFMFVKDASATAGSASRDILKCRFKVANASNKGTSAWRDWKCPVTTATIDKECKKTWKAGRDKWEVTLTLREPGN